MRVGMVAYACKQGLGYLAKSFFDAGIINEVIQVKHKSHANYPKWYNTPYVVSALVPFTSTIVSAFLKKVDIVLFFETPFDWTFPLQCRKAGIITVCMPMYEWFPKNKFDIFDYYLAPSKLDMDYFPRSILFQPPVDPKQWRLRTQVTSFLHNAGNIGSRNHKGTEELLAAIRYIKSPLKLTIRTQAIGALNRLLSIYPILRNDSRIKIQLGEIPYEDLFVNGDCYIAPEKYNGLSLPLQEAYAAGMLVMTTNRYPANTWLPTEPLIPVESMHKASISSAYLEFDECVVNPRIIAETMDSWYGRDITEYSLQAKQWTEKNSWSAKRSELLSVLKGMLND